MANGVSSIGPKLRKLGYGSYRAYLLSPHWQDVRKRYWASGIAVRHCKGCLRKDVPLQLHHTTYKRLGNEYLRDLVPVCDDCHNAIHAQDRIEQGKNADRIKRKKLHLWNVTSKVLRDRR